MKRLACLLLVLVCVSCGSPTEYVRSKNIVGRSIYYNKQDVQVVGYNTESGEYYLSNGETVTYEDIKDSL